MNADDPVRAEAVRWLESAAEGLAAARLCASATSLNRSAAYHCQQAAEKALKAGLLGRRISPGS